MEMQTSDNKIANPALSLSVSEQLVFLIESLPDENVNNYFKEHYLFAVVTGCIADLFLLNKITVKNSRINIINNEKLNITVLDNILNEIKSFNEEKTIFDILMEMTIQQMSEIEEMIVEDLIAKKFLVRKHEGFFIFGKSSVHAKNDEFRLNLYNVLKEGLNSSEEPPSQIIYLLTLLDGIEFLAHLFDSKKELDYSRKHLETLIENNHLAKLLFRAIENEIKLRDLEKMPKQRSGGMGMGGGRF